MTAPARRAYGGYVRPSRPHFRVRVSHQPPLDHPPINEVVCGFVFEPLPLSTLDFGVYWEGRRDDYPRHELHPPVLDGGGIRLGPVVDARAWLVAASEEFLLQLQSDRFYVNWRRRGDSYPRFSDYEDGLGLKSRAIQEFETFAAFASERAGAHLGITRLELTKIDLFESGRDYEDLADLQDLIGVTRVFEQVSSSDPRQLQLRLVEGDGPTSTQISVSMDPKKVRIETRHLFPFNGDLNDDFDAANKRVNEVFFGLVNTTRFRRSAE